MVATFNFTDNLSGFDILFIFPHASEPEPILNDNPPLIFIIIDTKTLLHEGEVFLYVLVARLGFEPRLHDSESWGLPLADLAAKTQERVLFKKHAQYSRKQLNFQILSDGDDASGNTQKNARHEQNEPQREEVLRKIRQKIGAGKEPREHR